MSMSKCKTEAFTLMEMLVASSMLIVILSIVLMGMGRLRSTARTAIGISNLSQIHTGVLSFAFDNGNTLPLGYDKDAKIVGDCIPPVKPEFGGCEAGGYETDWSLEISHYLTVGGKTYQGLHDVSDDTLSGIFHCPSAQVAGGINHYGANPVLMPDLYYTNEFYSEFADWGWSTSNRYKQYRLVWARRSHETILVADASQDPGHKVPGSAYATLFKADDRSLVPDYKGPGDPHPYYDRNDNDNSEPIDPGPDVDVASSQPGGANFRWRQSGRANVLYLDGSAMTVAPGEVTKRNLRADKPTGL